MKSETNVPIGKVTLIGTGGGYGESIVLGLGNGDYCIIDSCINPDTKYPLNLEYLDSQNISYDAVKLIVITHWHDDHIRGLSKVFEKCVNADMCFPICDDKEKFLQFVSLDNLKVASSSSITSTKEFKSCLDISLQRKTPTKRAMIDRTLYSNELGVEIVSLSPSDYSYDLFQKELSTLIPEYSGSNKTIPREAPNFRSVVLLVKLGNHSAILGADLEVSDDNRLGWLNIINSSQKVDKNSNKATLFKIPHHGSKTGFHEDIWKILLSEQPISKLTPWNRNNKLPQQEMVDKYLSLSEKLLITSPHIGTSLKSNTDTATKKLLRKFNLKLEAIPYHKGIISSTISITDVNDKWKVSIEGTAQEISKQ